MVKICRFDGGRCSQDSCRIFDYISGNVVVCPRRIGVSRRSRQKALRFDFHG